METIITQVKDLAGAANEAARKKIIQQLQDLSFALESPDDVMARMTYRVRIIFTQHFRTVANTIISQHLEVAVARIGCDLKIFNLLAASGKPMSLEQLEQETGAAPVSLGKENAGDI